MKWKFDYNGKDFTDKVKTITELNLFKEIVLKCNKENLLWHNEELAREGICKSLEISPITFRRALQGLTESGLLLRKVRGTYKVNQEYVSYGQQQNEA